MPALVEPVVTLEKVKILAIHLSSLDLEVRLKVQNPNPVDAILRELPFTVYFISGGDRKKIATGNTGQLEIKADGSTIINVPVTSYDLALIEALATIIGRGGLRFEIQGSAVIDHILGWTLPFTQSVDITIGEIARAVEQKIEGK